MKFGLLLAVLLIGLPGVIFAADLWGVSSKWNSAYERWRARGRVRRRIIFHYVGARGFGAMLIGAAVLLMVAFFLAKK